MKTRLVHLSAFLFLLAGLTTLSCWLVMRWMPADPHGHSHDVIHKRLKLSKEQIHRLEPIEARYEEELRRGEAALRAAGLELARIIREERQDSSRVRAAVERIHEAMGEVQKTTLGHVFEMQQVLTPEQYDKLLELTARGIEEANGEH